MTDDDPTASRYRRAMADPSLPTARGIMLCLSKLAEEAADLGLLSAHAAIRHAIDICAQEHATGRAAAGLSHLN